MEHASGHNPATRFLGGLVFVGAIVGLWELLTGRRLFTGETADETLANVQTAPMNRASSMP